MPSYYDPGLAIASFSSCIASGRLDLAFAVDKDVMLYAKAEFAGDRLHLVAADTRQQQVIEIVVIGNRVYLRENTNTRWQATTVIVEDPADVGVPVDTDLDEIEQYVALSNLGRVDMRGIPTTQYQAQITPWRWAHPTTSIMPSTAQT